ncbi:hypothetical protein AMTRI_Chr01g105310 [Amborella trichopoda]
MVTWFGAVGMIWMWRRDWCNCSYLCPELLTIIHGAPSRYTWHGLQSSFTLLLALMATLSLSLYLSLSLLVFCFCFHGSPIFTLVLCVLMHTGCSWVISLSLYIYIYIYLSLYLSLTVCFFVLF